MKSDKVDIQKVLPNSYNPNEMSEKNFTGLKKSLQLFGQVRPIICRPAKKKGFFEIIDGEHTLKALQELGQDKIDIIIIDKITDEQAKALTIALDRIHGEISIKDLEKIVFEIQADFEIESLKLIAQYDFESIEKEADAILKDAEKELSKKTEKHQIEKPRQSTQKADIDKSLLGVYLYVPVLIKQACLDFIKSKCKELKLDWKTKEIQEDA